MKPAVSHTGSVLIAGAGPSGLAMAIDLERRGVQYRIIDIARSATDKSKAIGVQARTLELFDNMGLACQFTEVGHKCHGARIHHDSLELAHARFDDLDTPFPYILMVPQSDTERILIDHLESLGGKIEREVRLESFSQNADGVAATLVHPDGQTEEVQTGWLIGCDGAHSVTRHILGLPFEGADYAEGYLLADLKIEWANSEDELYAYTHGGWLLAAFPMPGGRWRLIADLPPDEAPVDKSPSLAELQKLVDGRCPIKTTLSDPIWTANYRIHRRIVSKMRQGHVFLVGDAAHIHSPAGAQGMNTGIQDALNLSWKLALVSEGLAAEGFLDSYHDERYPVEKSVLALANAPLAGLGLRGEMAASVRDRLVRFLSGLGFLKHEITERISEIGIQYHNSPIVEEHHLAAGPAAGDRAPDVTFEDGGSLHGLLRGPNHKLLFFGHGAKFDDFGEELNAVKDVATDKLGGHVQVYNFNTDQAAARRYGAQKGAVYLVRPDGYIGFRSPLYGSEEQLRSYLDMNLTATK